MPSNDAGVSRLADDGANRLTICRLQKVGDLEKSLRIDRGSELGVR